MKWERERKRRSKVNYVDHFEQESPEKREARLRQQLARKWNEPDRKK